MLMDTGLSHLGCGFSAVSRFPTIALGEEDTLDPPTGDGVGPGGKLLCFQ